jgi:hypothetical protein
MYILFMHQNKIKTIFHKITDLLEGMEHAFISLYIPTLPDIGTDNSLS